jgi:membrane-associated phospholipid phosphatase
MNITPGYSFVLVIRVCLLLFTPFIRAQDNLPGINQLFHNIGGNVLNSFSTGYGLYHAAAIASTYGLVNSGADWRYYQTMVQHKYIAIAGFPSVILGGIVPLAVPAYLYFKGKSQRNPDLIYTGFALGQAAVISLLISSSYKAVTGRHPPNTFEDDTNTTDYSGDFHFGFMRRGIFNGWPSGHTTSAFAMATTLIELYPDKKNLKLWAMGYAVLVGWSVSTNIHWLSDAVAGVLIGYAIGKTVGRSFHSLMNKTAGTSNSNLSVTPSYIQLSFSF